MASYTLNRSDLFPVGTAVSAFAVATPQTNVEGPTPGVAVETQTVGAAGTAAFVALAADTPYVFYALVSGEHRKLRARVSSFDYGRAAGTGDTTSGSTALANVAATSGAFAVGQRVTGPGIPAGTFLVAGSGAAWTMSDKASATAVGVALEGHGAQRWRAVVKRRRLAIGTS